MARLSLLTRSDAVEAAVSEFRRLGRDIFLQKYGFEGSRDYFLRVDGELYDSKPIVAVAFGIQHPANGALRSSDFSGGTDGAAKALRRLGYEVTTRAELHPPQLGDEFIDRTAVQAEYGGDKVAGIVRFPGERIVNVFSDAKGPYADEPPSLHSEFGYRGEGLIGPQKLESSGNTRLESARLEGAAVRFWYKPVGQSWRFWCWASVVGRAWVNGVDEAKQRRPEIEWRLTMVPGPNPDDWPERLTTERANAIVADSPEGEPAASPGASYAQLCHRVGAPAPASRNGGRFVKDFQRNVTARQAVLVRSNGLCENSECTGMPSELGRNGLPILDVDHINDLALEGDDHPTNMIALCPNCHASKTRGQNPLVWRRKLLRAAAKAHEAALRRSGASGE